MAKPAIYYDNRFDDATPTASTTATGYAVANLTDWRPYTWWKPTAIPATVTVDCGAAKAADYALIAGHNLGSTGHRIQVRGSTDNFSASDVLVASKATDSDSPLLATFTAAEYRYWRLMIAAANLLLHSQDYSNAVWSKGDDVVITINDREAPDGTITADKYDTTGAGSARQISQTVSFSSAVEGRSFVFSVYVYTAGSGETLSNQRIAGTYNASGPSQALTQNAWTRLSWAFTVSGSTGSTLQVYCPINSGANDNRVLWMWGAQLEEVAAGTTEPGPYVATGATTTSGTPSLAIAAIGSAFELHTYLPQGFDPTGRQVESSVNRNANGQPLGRVIDYERWEQTITQQSIPWAWVRSTFEPAWVAHLRSSPFGFCWEPSSYADEVRLVVAGARFDTPHRSGLLADLSFEVSGVLE